MPHARERAKQALISKASAIHMECGGTPPLLREFDAGEKTL
jgi:hypothetical protein